MRSILSLLVLLCVICANAFAQTTLRFHDGGSASLRAMRINGVDYCPVSSLKQALAKHNFQIEIASLPGSFFIVVKNPEQPSTLQMSLPSLADGSGETLLPLASALLALEDANYFKLQLSRDIAVISSSNDRDWERLVQEETFLPNASPLPVRAAAIPQKDEENKIITGDNKPKTLNPPFASNPEIIYSRPNSFNMPSDLIRKELESEHIIK